MDPYVVKIPHFKQDRPLTLESMIVAPGVRRDRGGRE